MAGERLPARFSLLSQLWFLWTEKCFETATSLMQTAKKQLSFLTKPFLLSVNQALKNHFHKKKSPLTNGLFSIHNIIPLKKGI